MTKKSFDGDRSILRGRAAAWEQRQIPDLNVYLAMNHWALAIDTHNTNFPDTYHDLADVSAVDPRRYPSTDILVTSPECFPAGTLILTTRGLSRLRTSLLVTRCLRIGADGCLSRPRWTDWRQRGSLRARPHGRIRGDEQSSVLCSSSIP